MKPSQYAREQQNSMSKVISQPCAGDVLPLITLSDKMAGREDGLVFVAVVRGSKPKVSDSCLSIQQVTTTSHIDLPYLFLGLTKCPAALREFHCSLAVCSLWFVTRTLE